MTDDEQGKFTDYESLFTAAGMAADDPDMDPIRSVDKFFRYADDE